ncbi:MAG: hypothetical protein K2Y01_01235 [Rhabdochlamydiaceae bacterium]|nr:hypothetical protein [Rhabdochlamydiaceae bacterium]
MTIPSIMSEPTFLRNMYESFTSALQKDDSSFSMREFVKEYLEIQSPEALPAAKIIPLIQKRMLNERPHYEPIFHALFPNTIGFKLVSEKLLTFAESLRRTGYQETEVQFFQKYAFQFAILSIWNQSKKFSDQDCLRKSFEQFEALRRYRQDLSQILQVESSQIVNLMKKVLPRHFSSSDVQAQAEALQQQIQNFFNENLHKEKEDRIFPVKGLGLMIGAHMENKLGELICYRAERSAGIASHLLLSREGKSPVFNACRVSAVEVDPTKELAQRNTLSQIPGINEIITPAPAVYRTSSGFLLRSPLNWDILHNQIELDPFIFSGIELIEISKQILQAVQKLTEHHYIHSSLGLEHIAVRKTEAGIEAMLGDPEQIIPLSNWGKEIGHSSAYYAFNQGKKQISQEIVLNEFSIFLAKTLLGIDDLHKDPLQQLFQQVEEVVSPENYEQILFLKKQSDRYGESYVHNLKNYVKRLRSDDGDIFSISALEQFIEKNLILSCIYPFISDSTSSPSAILPTARCSTFFKKIT